MNIERLVDGLPVIGYGLLGIFIVIGVISLILVGMSKIFSSKGDKN